MDIAAHSDGCIDAENVLLGAENLGRLLEDPESLLLRESSFTVKVVLEEGDVGLVFRRAGEELFVGGNRHGRCLHLGTLSARANIYSAGDREVAQPSHAARMPGEAGLVKEICLICVEDSEQRRDLPVGTRGKTVYLHP